MMLEVRLLRTKLTNAQLFHALGLLLARRPVGLPLTLRLPLHHVLTRAAEVVRVAVAVTIAELLLLTEGVLRQKAAAIAIPRTSAAVRV
jgi:hypothetical protein